MDFQHLTRAHNAKNQTIKTNAPINKNSRIVFPSGNVNLSSVKYKENLSTLKVKPFANKETFLGALIPDKNLSNKNDESVRFTTNQPTQKPSNETIENKNVGEENSNYNSPISSNDQARNS